MTNTNVTDTAAEQIITLAAQTLETFERYITLKVRFEADATADDRKAFDVYLAKVRAVFPTIAPSCFGMTVEELSTLDEAAICTKLNDLKEKAPEKYADYAEEAFITCTNLQAYIRIAVSFLAEWNIKSHSPLTMFGG